MNHDLIIQTGLINKFLSWGIFLSLARITYMVYIIHFDVLLAFFNTITYSVELTDVIVVSIKNNLSLSDYINTILVLLLRWLDHDHFWHCICGNSDH